MTSSKISLFPDFLQISHFLDLASCSSVKKEPEWILPIAGENCTECRSSSPISLETIPVLLQTTHIACPSEHTDKPRKATPCRDRDLGR